MNMKLILALTIVFALAWVIASAAGYGVFSADNGIEIAKLPNYYYRKFRKKYTKLGSLIPVFFITISALPILIPGTIVTLILMGVNDIKKLYDRIFIERPKSEPQVTFVIPSAENNFERPEVPVIQIMEDTRYERR